MQSWICRVCIFSLCKKAILKSWGLRVAYTDNSCTEFPKQVMKHITRLFISMDICHWYCWLKKHVNKFLHTFNLSFSHRGSTSEILMGRIKVCVYVCMETVFVLFYYTWPHSHHSWCLPSSSNRRARLKARSCLASCLLARTTTTKKVGSEIGPSYFMHSECCSNSEIVG